MADPRIEIDDHLALRAWQPDDAPRLFELVTANRGHLAAWFDWVDGYTSMDRPRRFVELARAAYADGTGLDLALTVNGEIAGAAGFVTCATPGTSSGHSANVGAPAGARRTLSGYSCLTMSRSAMRS